MLEKLIANLKESLPEPLRKRLGMEDNIHDEEPSEEHSDEESEESHDTSDNETQSEEDIKKKRISMLIRVIVVLGLAYLAVDQFVLKNNDSNTEIANIPVRPRRPRKKPVIAPVAVTPEVTKEVPPPAEKAPAEVAAEPVNEKVVVAPSTAPEVTVETQKAETVAEAPPETAPPVENINIADKKTEEATEPAASEPSAPAVGEVKSSETQVDKSIDSLIESVDSTEKSEAPASKKETKLEDKIVEDDVYTPPPAYDQIGRGLVYNCKEKYWACVDKLAYVACNKNMKWNKGHGKSAECAIQNVYNSDEDCGTVQKYNVSTSKPTPFCQ